MKRSFAIVLLIFVISVYPRTIMRIYEPFFVDEKWDIAFINDEYVDIVIPFKKANEAFFHSKGISFEFITQNTDLSGYSSFEDIIARIDLLCDSYPNMIKKYDIGDTWEKVKLLEDENYNVSYEKKDIWAYKITEDVEIENHKSNIVFMATHHARELETSEILVTMMEKFIDGIEVYSAEEINIHEKYNLWFIPVVNPDGYQIVFNGTDLLWRKNNRDNNLDGSYAATDDGVDLNRNYEWEWGGIGSSSLHNSEVYRGSAPFSEYEIIAISELFETLKPIGSISYHSYGELVLYPFGYSSDYAPDHQRLSEIAYQVSRELPKSTSGSYTPQKSSSLYPASGESDDHLYGAFGTFAFTIEVGTEFHPIHSELGGLAEINYNAMLEFIKQLNTNFIKGIVYDSHTGLPIDNVNYQIMQLSNYDKISPRVTNTQGQYYWNLPDGEYTVCFSKNGYYVHLDSFVINADSVEMDVYLYPKEKEFPIHAEIFPNPAKKNTTIGLRTDSIGTVIECSIYSTDGRLIYKFPKKTTSGNFLLDSFFLYNDRAAGLNFASGIYFVHIRSSHGDMLFEKILKLAIVN